MFQRLPYQLILDAIEERRYCSAVGFVVLANVRMVLIQWVLGLLFLAPLMALFSAVVAGALFSLGERRTLFPYAFINMIFEWGAFAAGAAAGLITTWNWLFGPFDFGEALVSSLPYLAFALVLLVLNGLVEAVGPVYYGIKGIPPVEVVRNRQYR